MPQNLDFQLSETELLQVTEAIRKDKRPEVRHRATAIRQLSLGKRPTEVAESLAVQPTTVYSWFHRFRQDGLEGLVNRPKGRPKRKADEAYCRALEAAIEHDPEDYGYPFAIWTVERLRDHLEKETGKSVQFFPVQFFRPLIKTVGRKLVISNGRIVLRIE